MRTIYKYPIEQGKNIIEMPYGSRFRKAMIQTDLQAREHGIQTWFEVNTESPKAKRCIYVLATGEEIPKDLIYLDSVQMGYFIWHLYEAYPPALDETTGKVPEWNP